MLALRSDAAAIGTALLAGSAAGMGAEGPAAVASVLRSARRYEPSPAADGLKVRLQWYETTRAAAAVRGDWGSR